MKSKRTLKTCNFKTCNLNYFKPSENPVQNGLAMTPQQIKALTDKGIPVSLPNLSIIDADVPSSYLPLEHRRGVDLNTCYEASTSLRDETIKTYKRLKTK